MNRLIGYILNLVQQGVSYSVARAMAALKFSSEAISNIYRAGASAASAIDLAEAARYGGNVSIGSYLDPANQRPWEGEITNTHYGFRVFFRDLWGNAQTAFTTASYSYNGIPYHYSLPVSITENASYNTIAEDIVRYLESRGSEEAAQLLDHLKGGGSISVVLNSIVGSKS